MGEWVSLGVFLATSLVVLLVLVSFNRDDARVAARVRTLAGRAGGREPAAGPAPADSRSARVASLLGAWLGPGPERAQLLAGRFHRAGFYGTSGPLLFQGARVVLPLLGLLLGTSAWLAEAVPERYALPGVACLVGVGWMLPGVWLDWRGARRQGALRRGMPDALDMLVLCLEGGTSLGAAIQNVTGELKLAHPELGGEMEVVQHEMLLGRTAGEAIRSLADRSALDDLASLATVLQQNELYGVSVARALRVHADGMRLERQQRAEEMAQKAAVKILFPTLLCIFPAVFVIVLGPAAFRIHEIFSRMR